MSIRSNKGMENSYFVVEYTRTFKHLLEEAFKIQQIKFTSYDASKHYIVFGANIGSLYAYHIENITKCIKVLPSNLVKPITIISISPNEDNILFSDETGSIIIFEKCFSEKLYQTHIFNQQKGKIITAVQWEGNNKAYIGDSEGTIAVLSIKSKLMLSLLHTPYVSLMDLHSRVIQIDVLSPLLLISTDKKTYICNQEQERYKQVGTQETAKGYGACFFCNAKGVNLYCSRPGLRLWQANLGGEVFSTQKYKGVDSLITEILKFREGPKDCLQVEKLNSPREDKVNFGKVQIFSEKFLCITNSENVYIVDPEERRIIFHYCSDQPMDVRLVKKKLFIKFSSGKFLILNFYKFEELMNEIYFKKLYSTGIRFLLRYRKITMDWLKTSPNVKLITNLQQNMSGIDEELVQQFENLVNEFKTWEEKSLKEFLDAEDPKIKNCNQEEPKPEQTEQLGEEMELMCKKYDLYQSCNVIYMPQFSAMLSKLDEDEMAQIFLDFINYKKSKEIEVEMCWCYKEYLHHFDLKKGHKRFTQLKKETVFFLKKCYENVEAGINIDSCTNVSCNFPLPSPKTGFPKYDKIGKALVKYCEDSTLLKKKPFVWLHKLNQITTIKSLKTHLPVILQFGHLGIFQKFQKHVTYNFCYDVVKLFLELKRGKCLNCGTDFDVEYSKFIPEWEKLGLALVPLIGADNVLRIFSDFQQHIPKDSLTDKFYLACVFSEIRTKEQTTENSIEMALRFLNSANTQLEFRNAISAFLIGKVDKNNVQPTTIKKELTCRHCDATLPHPVLKQIKQMECGHAFHAICLNFHDNICNVCTPNQ